MFLFFFFWHNRACRWVQFRTGPSPLWSPTGCTISEPDPNLAPACGVTGAQTFLAGLRRRVSNWVLTCGCVYCVYFCTWWMKAPLILSQAKQTDKNGGFTIPLWYLIYASYHIMKYPFLSFAFFLGSSSLPSACKIPISHWNRPYWVACLEQNQLLVIRHNMHNCKIENNEIKIKYVQ